jgi:thioesterase domain-containing protein
MSAQTRLQGLSPAEKRELLAKLLAREAARARSFPLSFSQQRLWLLDQIDPGTPAYNVSRHVRIYGRLDAVALERGLDDIVRRHEALRTRIALIDDEPAQVVGRPAPFALESADLRGLPAAAREEALRELSHGEACHRFDLTRDLMLRARLVLLDAEEHALLLTFHHIAVDGWSIEIFMDELGAAYEAHCAGCEPALAELPIQYSDYATWQRERPEDPADLAYWHAALEAAPPLLQLPSDRPRPLVPTFAGASIAAMVPRALADEIAALGRAGGATTFMVLLAAFDALLVRYGCGEDLVVGTPIAGRSRPELEPLIGFFVNTLALRVDCSGDPTLSELLERVKAVTLGAFERQAVPFERVVEAVHPRRIPGANALVQVLFALQSATRERSTLGGLRLERIPADNRTAKFDLTLSISEMREGLELRCEYSTALFDEATIRRLFADYEAVLAAFAAAPGSRISALPAHADSRPAEASLLATAETAAATALPAEAGAPLDAQVGEPLRALWEALLGTTPIGADDDFFELGGHSLAAARLLAECGRRFGRRVPFGEFYAAPTLRALARSLSAPAEPGPVGLLWRLRTAGERVPFFFLHGDTAGGGPYCRKIARGLGPDQPFYAFAPHASDGGPMPPSIGAMADDYIARIQALQSSGPYRIGGFCHGGTVAFEIAQRLTARGFAVDRLVIVNAPAPERRFVALGRVFRTLAPLLHVAPRRRQVLQLLLAARIVRIRAAFRHGPGPGFEQIGDLFGRIARNRDGMHAASEAFVDPALDDCAFEALLRAQRSYRAQPYPGRLALFWAEGEPQLYDGDPANGWRRFAREVEVVSIPGDHMSSVLEHGERVGALIRGVLSEGPQRSAATPNADLAIASAR